MHDDSDVAAGSAVGAGAVAGAVDGAADPAQWLRAIAVRGDRAAFAALFGHYAPRIKALLMRSGATAEAAEDFAQETLLAVWRKAGLYDPQRARDGGNLKQG